MTFEELQSKIVDWAKQRKIIPNAKPHTQLLKAFSEMGELADAEIKGQATEAKDAVGDVLVCIINYCALKDLSIIECLDHAWLEIKDRKGTTTPEGTFIKEAN